MMGFLANLFGYIPPEEAPVLQSIYPPAAAGKLLSGTLPLIQPDKLILHGNEVCHFVDVGAIITEKKRYHSARTGGSFHVFKGYTAHIGQTQTVPVNEPEYTKGIFYITSQRTVFVSRKHGFDKSIKSLTAVTEYSDGLSLQFGQKTYNLLLPCGNVPKAALDLLL